ncbi:MAG TPA: hypothetical protein VFZ65_02460 [Planctomycetota bacterium]|nr:hypothetical protein [Planctomycetota bacterium]
MLSLLFQNPDVPVQAGSEFGNTTDVHPVGLAALVVTAALAMLVPRRWASLPVILLLCFIPAGQRVVLATIDFTFIRVLMLVVWARLLLRGEVRPLLWNHLDRCMVLWAGTCVVTGTLLAMTVTVFINRLGNAVDAMMAYFCFRQLIRDYRDVVTLATQFILCSLPVAAVFLVESRTGKNMFAFLGGVPPVTDVRDGRLRCQGAFAHAILAGCFWACLIPFYFVCGWIRGRWILPVAGIAAAIAIVVMCASSTPIMAVAFGVVGGAAFLVRGTMPWIRWLVVLWLGVLHFFLMKQPVWHLLARVDIVGGSTGWHRFHLVDKFIDRFQEWWLLGTIRTGHWGPGLQDVTNQFVAEGVNGGVSRLLLFVATIWLAFAGVSRSLRLPESSQAYRFVSWALGTALFMHCMNFIAVSYFDQIMVTWYMTLASISSLTLVPGATVARQLGRLQVAAT